MAEVNQNSARLYAFDGIEKRVTTNGIVHNRYSPSICDLFNPLNEVFLGVNDGVVTTMGLGEVCFLVRTNCANDGSTTRLGPLTCNQANASGRGMEDDCVAGRDLVSPFKQIFYSHAL